MDTFKIAIGDSSIDVEIIDTFMARGRLFCVHAENNNTFGDIFHVSDYLTGRKVDSCSGFDSAAMVMATASRYIDEVPDEKWNMAFNNIPVLNSGNIAHLINKTTKS